MNESQNIEYKESWRDEYLKWICGFANAQGGKMYIGITDSYEVIGVADAKRLMDDIPNKIVNMLGIVADVNLLEKDNKQYIEIVVDSSPVPISLKGVYHYRSGSTKQILNGVSLQQFILKKMGRSWDEMPRIQYDERLIDRKAIDYFLSNAISKERIGVNSRNEDTKAVLSKLRLLTDNGELTNAAILLFGNDPIHYFSGAKFKIGRFGEDETDLIFDDVIEGNILQMADKVIAILKSKYLISPILYEGIHRKEVLELPEESLREMIYNAIVHKDYSGVPIQMWVYNDHVELWNQGNLPSQLSIEGLLEKHRSYPRNQLIANVFYLSGFIESWGRGIAKIRKGFIKANIEEPKFEENQGGVLVTFKRKMPGTTPVLPQYHPSTTPVEELLKVMGDGAYSIKELMGLMNLKNLSHFKRYYLQPAIQQSAIEPIEKPNHPRQKYRKKKR